ncbi:MAG: tyrosine-type recombinase/integrase [Alphaproteobacteria bacterium]
MARASIYREKLLDQRTGRVRASQTWYLQVIHNGRCYTRSARTLDKEKALSALQLLQAEVYEAEHDRGAAAQIARTAEITPADGSSGWRGRGRAMARSAIHHGVQLGARAGAGVWALARLSGRLAQARMETPKVDESDAEPGWQGYCLSEAEEARLLAAAPPFMQDLMVFLLGTGAEPEEAVALTWQAVDLAGEAAMVRLGGDGVLPSRMVPLPEAVRDLLARLELKAVDVDRVFLSTRSFGGRVPLEDAAPAFRLLRKKANLKHVELRDLRYTYATRLIADGVGAAEAAKLLGAPLQT